MINCNRKLNFYQLKLPIELDIFIPDDDSVRILSDFVDEMDLNGLFGGDKWYGRKKSIPELVMLKILLYGYMQKRYSSRDIESSCKRDINFMWLLQGRAAPSHNKIARFRVALGERINEIFTRFVQQLKTLGEIEGENLFVDGTKLEANASKYTFVWAGATEKNSAKLEPKIAEYLERIHNAYGIKFCTLNGAVEYLSADTDLFRYGRGARKPQVQRDYEEGYELKRRQDKYEDYMNTFDGRRSFSKTDRDATFMRMKEDRMKNGQLKPGYNIQIGVESEYIVGTHISSERTDQLTFIPFLESLEKRGLRYENVIADAGYESEENYRYLSEHQQTAYIKPQNYERSKRRAYKKKIGRRENMVYDAEADEYICHNGKRLRFVTDTKRRTKSGYEQRVSVYRCEDCAGCPVRALCTQAKNGKELEVAKAFAAFREQSLANITSPRGILLRMNRSIQVEGAFGILKQDMQYRRFLTRGKNKISTEMLLLAMAYNLNKRHNNLINDRTGFTLHPIPPE